MSKILMKAIFSSQVVAPASVDEITAFLDKADMSWKGKRWNGSIIPLYVNGGISPNQIYERVVTVDTFPVVKDVTKYDSGTFARMLLYHTGGGLRDAAFDNYKYFMYSFSESKVDGLISKDQTFNTFGDLVDYINSNYEMNIDDTYKYGGIVTVYFYQSSAISDIPRIYPKNRFLEQLKGTGGYAKHVPYLDDSVSYLSTGALKTLIGDWYQKANSSHVVDFNDTPSWNNVMKTVWIMGGFKNMYNLYPVSSVNDMSTIDVGDEAGRLVYSVQDDQWSDTPKYITLVNTYVVGLDWGGSIVAYYDDKQLPDKRYQEDYSYVRVYVLGTNPGNADNKFAFAIKPMGQDKFTCGYNREIAAKQLFLTSYNDYRAPQYHNITPQVTFSDDPDHNSSFDIEKPLFKLYTTYRKRNPTPTNVKSFRLLTCDAPGYFTSFSQSIDPVFHKRGMRYGFFLSSPLR